MEFRSQFSLKTFVGGALWKRVNDTVPMSTHNLCFAREINYTIPSSNPLFCSYVRRVLFLENIYWYTIDHDYKEQRKQELSEDRIAHLSRVQQCQHFQAHYE